MERKITEIPVECPCTVCGVQGEGKLRLSDLGFSRGSRVLPLYECYGGGTRVYRVKDTLIALRNRDAENISVEEVADNEWKAAAYRVGRESEYGEKHCF